MSVGLTRDYKPVDFSRVRVNWREGGDEGEKAVRKEMRLWSVRKRRCDPRV